MIAHSHLGTTDALRCGCDRDATGTLMPIDEALAVAMALLSPVAAAERLDLIDATGRVLAGPIYASQAIPPFDVAAMDGYAVRRSDLEGHGPWQLRMVGRVRAGDPPTSLPPAGVLRILTGAALPWGADAVIPQEQVTLGENTVRIDHLPRLGAHIRPRGDDLEQGAQVLPQGRLIGPREAGALAAGGHGQVEVYRKLKVALLTTGSELIEPGHPLTPGQTWNSNRFALATLLSAPWISLQDLGTVVENPVRLRRALTGAADQADLVVTTGGVSVGDEDHLPHLVREVGGAVHVGSVAMKPGQPLTIGTIGGTPWIGLPGNLVAAFVGWTVIGARMAEAMAGIIGGSPRKQVVRLDRPAQHRSGRCEFRLARFLGYDGHGVPTVEPLAGEASHRGALLAQADGLALFPADAEALPAGTLLEFLPF